jgi:hypothetical protein
MLLNELDAKKVVSEARFRIDQIIPKGESFNTNVLSRDQKDWPKMREKIKMIPRILGDAEHIGLV